MKSYEKGISLSIWTLSWPIFIEVFLQLLVGNIDQVMMSHYSPQAVAAVANANQILNIFIMLIIVMSTATTILIAQYLGARNQSKLSEVCTVSLVLNFLFSSVAAVFFITCHEWIFTRYTSRNDERYVDIYDHCGRRITDSGYVLCAGCRI